MLFFTNHQSDYNGELKARKDYNAEHCAAAMITSKDGLKAQWEYRTDDFAATMVMGNDGLNTQQEYRTDDFAATMVMGNNGQKANGNKAQKIVEQP